jgi:hypothetical protein
METSDAATATAEAQATADAATTHAERAEASV